jgi:hypothetical protein
MKSWIREKAMEAKMTKPGRDNAIQDELAAKYQNYKQWLWERHFDSRTWVLNWDLRIGSFAEFGKGEGLFYSAIFLSALALEGNESEYTALLSALNKEKYAPGMYPRYRQTFDTSKDPYYQFILALVYGQLVFPQNLLIQTTIAEIIDAIRANDYQLKNPDGSGTTYGSMIGFIPVFRCLEGKYPLFYYLSLLIFPLYAFIRKILLRKNYYNLLMMVSHYLIYHLHKRFGVERWFLKISVMVFAFVERRNPFFLMVRDLIFGSQKYLRKVENILKVFPGDRLPNDEEPIAHLDVLWQRDPAIWRNHEPSRRYEYSGVDYMILYQFYRRHYVNHEARLQG